MRGGKGLLRNNNNNGGAWCTCSEIAFILLQARDRGWKSVWYLFWFSECIVVVLKLRLLGVSGICFSDVPLNFTLCGVKKVIGNVLNR